MGNDASSLSDSSGFMNKLELNYDFHTELSNNLFGDICVYKHKTDKKYIAKRGHMCNSEEGLNAYIKNCRVRQKLRHKHILQLLHFHESSQDNICGDFNKMTIYFEYYFHDLQKELMHRSENGNEFFSESELWYLLDSLIKACSTFERHKIFHGDLKPASIMLTNDGQVKIGDNGIIQVDQSGYYKMLSRRDKSLLSPFLLRSLSVGEYKPFQDPWKSDVYSLGMTILEAASLCRPFCAYDFDHFQVLNSVVEDLLEECKNRYSQFFLNVIRDMLNEEESNRPSFDELSAVLQPFQASIVDSQDMKRSSVVYSQDINSQQPQQMNQYHQSQLSNQQMFSKQPQALIQSQNYPQVFQNPAQQQYLPTRGSNQVATLQGNQQSSQNPIYLPPQLQNNVNYLSSSHLQQGNSALVQFIQPTKILPQQPLTQQVYPQPNQQLQSQIIYHPSQPQDQHQHLASQLNLQQQPLQTYINHPQQISQFGSPPPSQVQPITLNHQQRYQNGTQNFKPNQFILEQQQYQQIQPNGQYSLSQDNSNQSVEVETDFLKQANEALEKSNQTLIRNQEISRNAINQKQSSSLLAQPFEVQPWQSLSINNSLQQFVPQAQNIPVQGQFDGVNQSLANLQYQQPQSAAFFQ